MLVDEPEGRRCPQRAIEVAQRPGRGDSVEASEAVLAGVSASGRRLAGGVRAASALGAAGPIARAPTAVDASGAARTKRMQNV